MSAALEYHRRTNIADFREEDELRYEGPRPPLVKTYPGADRVPLETAVAGPLLRDGAGVVRSQPGRDYGGGTMHWRAYSSAGALYPVEAYAADREGLYSFDPVAGALVRVAEGDARAAVGAAADAAADSFVVLTGIHARTGWKYLERGYRHVWWDAGTMLANLLALAAADDLRPRLYVGFVDRELNDVLGVDGTNECALAVLGLGRGDDAAAAAALGHAPADATAVDLRFPLARAAHGAGVLEDVAAVREWRSKPEGEEPKVGREELVRAIRSRRSVRSYSEEPLPRDALAELLAWSEARVPADVASVVRQAVTVHAVDGLRAGVYDARLELVREHDEQDLRRRVTFAAMEQEHLGAAAADVFQLADLGRVLRAHGDRGYRWAQLEAGIRAGRLQIGAFMRGWGAAASTFYDEEVSRLVGTQEAPMLMVALGARAGMYDAQRA